MVDDLAYCESSATGQPNKDVQHTGTTCYRSIWSTYILIDLDTHHHPGTTRQLCTFCMIQHDNSWIELQYVWLLELLKLEVVYTIYIFWSRGLVPEPCSVFRHALPKQGNHLCRSTLSTVDLLARTFRGGGDAFCKTHNHVLYWIYSCLATCWQFVFRLKSNIGGMLVPCF